MSKLEHLSILADIQRHIEWIETPGNLETMRPQDLTVQEFEEIPVVRTINFYASASDENAIINSRNLDAIEERSSDLIELLHTFVYDALIYLEEGRSFLWQWYKSEARKKYEKLLELEQPQNALEEWVIELKNRYMKATGLDGSFQN